MHPKLTLPAAFLLAFPVVTRAGDTTAIGVCNDTHDDVLVAISYKPVGVVDDRWLNSGWFAVEADYCIHVATTTNTYFYLYAEVYGDPSIWWGGNHPICVDSDESFDYWSVSQGYSCKEGQDLVGFTEHKAEWIGKDYVWNLTE